MSTKRTQKSYDSEFKAQAVKLAREIGGHKAAKELGVSDGTIYCWIKAFKEDVSVQMRQFIHLRQHHPSTMNLSSLENVSKNWIKKIVGCRKTA